LYEEVTRALIDSTEKVKKKILILILLLIPDVCRNGFFSQVISCTIGFSHELKKVIIWWQTSLGADGHSLQQSSCKFLKSTKFEANLIHAMDFAFVKLLSVSYLELYLARKGKTQQKCKQTAATWLTAGDSLIAPSWNSSSRDHILESMKETNGACNSLKKCHFNRLLGLIAMNFKGCRDVNTLVPDVFLDFSLHEMRN